LKQLRKRLTYANVMSSIAVFIVLGGAAFAAVQLPKNSVGTKQLKKNAVNSAKVKNGSLKAADFGKNQLPAGPQGPKGETGAKGETGPRGPSNAITRHSTDFFDWSNTFTTQFALNLPAGSWIVTSTAVANSNGGAKENVDCRLLVGGATVDEASNLILAPNFEPGERDAFSLTGGQSLPGGGSAELQCQSDGTGNVVDPSITAIQVGSLTVVPE
jgi:hypothetical protein